MLDIFAELVVWGIFAPKFSVNIILGNKAPIANGIANKADNLILLRKLNLLLRKNQMINK